MYKSDMLHSGDVFREHLDKFLRRLLHKGVPPLFVMLRPLYKDQDKVIIVNRVAIVPS